MIIQMVNQRSVLKWASRLSYGFYLSFVVFYSHVTISYAQDQKVKEVKVKPEAKPHLDQSFKGQVKQASQSLMETLNQEIKEQDLSFATLAVLPFKALDTGAKHAEVSAALAELFSTQLSSKGRIISVERGRMEGVVEELGRASKGEVSAKGAAQAGKLLGARYVLLGSVTTMGSTLQVTVRLVASETGEVIKGETMRAPRVDFVSFSRDVVVTKSKIGAAIRSLLVPGWGQLYNGDQWMGYSTLLAGLSALGTAAFYGYIGSDAQAKYQKDLPSTVGQRKIANASYVKARIALWSYAFIWTASIANAYISGQNHRQVDLNAWGDLEHIGLVLSGTF